MLLRISVERAALYLGVAELIDPRPVRQLATLDLEWGRHTFPIESGAPIVLDPRVTSEARDGAAILRRLARLEESGEPETSPIRPVSVPDTGAALVSEPTAQALEQLAWLEGQTAAMNESVTLLTTLVANGPADGGTMADYRQAGSNISGAVLTLVQSQIKGEPLDGVAEVDALDVTRGPRAYGRAR